MDKIERYSNWCWIDRLDGVDIQNGEVLFVRFPDGHAQNVTAVVKRRSVPWDDMGHPCSLPESFAYAEIEYHGVKSLLPLVGLEARRV